MLLRNLPEIPAIFVNKVERCTTRNESKNEINVSMFQHSRRVTFLTPCEMTPVRVSGRFSWKLFVENRRLNSLSLSNWRRDTQDGRCAKGLVHVQMREPPKYIRAEQAAKLHG